MNSRDTAPGTTAETEKAFMQALKRVSDLDEAFERQSATDRRPTLPLTEDGKVNVRAFTVDVCGLPRSAEQHFFKKPTLAALVNAVAMRQGVKPIGSRMLSDVADRGVRDRIRRRRVPIFYKASAGRSAR